MKPVADDTFVMVKQAQSIRENVGRQVDRETTTTKSASIVMKSVLSFLLVLVVRRLDRGKTMMKYETKMKRRKMMKMGEEEDDDHGRGRR